MAANPASIPTTACSNMIQLAKEDGGTQWLDPGPIGRRPRLLIAPAPENLSSSLPGQRCQLLGGTGLADSRFPGKHDYAALAGKGVIQGSLELGHLPLTADEDPTTWPCVDGGLTVSG